MRLGWNKSDRSVGFIAISLVLLIGLIFFSWPTKNDDVIFSQSEHLNMTVQDHHKKNESITLQHKPISPKHHTPPAQPDLEAALNAASMANKTLIITMLNKAYSQPDGLLPLFLQSFHEGENTSFLINHILFLTVDQTAFDQCMDLDLHCYRIGMDGGDLSDEVLYMTNGFIDMMWERTRFLGQVLKLGYSFIFTDMDILWLRNPFQTLHIKNDDILFSCDGYIGLPYDDRNAINTGFFYTSSNFKTVKLFQKWYESKNSSQGMKEQDVLNYMKSQGEFRNLAMKVRYLDLDHFSGMCQTKYNSKKVTVVHANCCRTMKAKVLDLKAMLKTWRFVVNGSLDVVWPRHKACHDSWKIKDDEDDEMETALKSVSGEEKTLIITVINKNYTEPNGFLDLFLTGLREGVETDYLMDRILFVAIDQIAFDRCIDLYLNCYLFETNNDFDFSQNLIKMRTDFLSQVLKRGYNFLFTDMDVLWLRNPFKFLNPKKSEDMLISCDGQNSQNNCTSLNTGFLFVNSNNKTISFFNNWYSNMENNNNYMKIQRDFHKFDMNVKYLDTKHFSGLCQDKYSVRKIIILHANCCKMMKNKILDLKSMFEAWLSSNNGRKNVKWPEKRACIDDPLKESDELEMRQEDASLQNKKNQTNVPDKLENALNATSMGNKTLIITIVNKIYAKKEGLLDLFLKSLKKGENTETLINHLLVVAMDEFSFDRCEKLNLHCYKGGNLKEEGEMMWRKIQFFGEVLKRGYNFIFTDVDTIWLRNPFQKLNRINEDLLMGCDRFDGLPFNESKTPLNPSFFFVSSNNKTVSFFKSWSNSTNKSEGLNEQNIVNIMKYEGLFEKSGIKIRVLDTRFFSGFCEESDDFDEVITIRANCCENVKSKLVDLKRVLEFYEGFNGTEMVTWPNHEACDESGGL